MSRFPATWRSPGRVLVVGSVAATAGFILCRNCTSGEGGTVLILQVRRVVVVQGEALPVFRRQLALRVEPGQGGGPGLLPGAGVPVAGGVEQVHGLPGQEPAVLPALGHAPHHRFNPASDPQGCQHPPQIVLGHPQDGYQVAHAGQGHPGDDSQESSLFII